MKLGKNLSVLFWLRSTKSDLTTKQTIYCRITLDGQRANFSTGFEVAAKYFNNAAGTIKGSGAEAVEINRQLLNIRTKILKHYTRLCELHEYVSLETLYNDVKGVKVERKTLIAAFEAHNNRYEKFVETKQIALGTLVKWKTTQKKIAAFLQYQFKQSDILLDQLSYSFAEDFFDYMLLEQKMQSNSAMKYIKNLKKILNMCVRRSWMQKNPINEFTCTYVHPERDILTEDEILKLYQKKFSIQRLEEARDCYLFMIFTGYAFKDAKSLSRGDISKFFDGEDWILKNRAKTWCRENVPLLPIAREIIEKYNNHPYCVAKNQIVPIKANQKFNAYLKEIADICEINKILTTHTARHTFATTITLSNGVPIETVSALLGHKSLKTTLIYAKIVAKKVSDDMKQLKGILQMKMPASTLDIKYMRSA